MTGNNAFLRKIVYFSLIGVLLVTLNLMSKPAAIRMQDGRQVRVEGGKLAELREAGKLSQANLGEIDPTSVTMKLSTFGLGGVASSILWDTAIDAKEREDWTTFDATLQQITNLQPHFVKVWQFQAHNVAFNISYEFDDYHDRYQHVIQGIELLEKGTRYNDCNPRIVRDLAHFIGFKIGKSDEADFYRPMFREDKEFQGTDRMAGTRYAGRPGTLTDNWQVSKWWYQWADRLIDSKLATYSMLTPVVVHSDAPQMQIQYARSLEEDGHFDEETRDQWRKAADEWSALGLRHLRTSYGYSIQLSELQSQQEKVNRLLEQFSKIASAEPQTRQRLEKQSDELLTPREREALAIPPRKQNSEQLVLAARAQQKLNVAPRELALAMSPAHREEATRLADDLDVAVERLRLIVSYRDIVNYEYWRVRCEVERMDETIAARKAIYEGNKAFAKGDLSLALARYNKGIKGWKQVIEKYPRLLSERGMVMEQMQLIDKYRKILSQNDVKPPSPFPLQMVLDEYQKIQEREKRQ